MTIFLIDYSRNKNHQELCGCVKSQKFLPNSKTIGFIYYLATEDAADYQSDTTHISLAVYGEKAIVNIKEFLTTLFLQSLRDSVETLKKIEKTSKPDFDTIIQNEVLSFLSIERNDISSSLMRTLQALEKGGQPNYTKLGTFFEISALAESVFPGIASELKLEEHYPSIPMMCGIDVFAERQNIQYVLYIISASCFLKAKSPTLVIGCILRAIQCSPNPTFLINEITNFITKLQIGPQSQFFEMCAFELVYIAGKYCPRKVPLICYKFLNVFTFDAKADFQRHLFHVLLKSAPNDPVLRNLCSNLITSIITSGQNPSIVSRLLLDFLSSCGPSLSKEDQENLFSRLLGITMGDARYPCNFGLVARKVKFIQPKVTFKSQGRPAEQSSIFKYSFLGNNSEQKEIEVGIGFKARVSFELFNPCKIPLLTSIRITDIPNCIVYENSQTISGNSGTNIVCGFVPKEPGSYTISTIECIAYHCVQKIMFEQPLTVRVIPDVVQFKYRTDLPMTHKISVFEGEKLSFNVWIMNSGNIPIENIQLQFPDGVAKTVSSPGLPVHPFTETMVNVQMTVADKMDRIKFDIVCSSHLSEILTVSEFVQEIEVKPAISLARIYTLEKSPDISADFSKFIFIAFDIVNNSSTNIFDYSIAFEQPYDIGCKFKSIVSNVPRSGMLSTNETMVSIVAVEKEILRNANKVDVKRAVIAAQNEEDRIKGRLSKQQREDLDKRVAISIFLETNLKFEWKTTGGRIGVLSIHSVIPSAELLAELKCNRPEVICNFVSCEKEKVPINKKVTLKIQYPNTLVKKCKIDLGMYMDPSFGIAWGEKLEQMDEVGKEEFEFTFFFTKPGKFSFGVEYSTATGICGFSCAKCMIVE
ncbi:hypothetical protein GPJ56_003842 [Histomonas meleagridis]|uniref:uncharacterized protein n=1 Tax=Histomonas meleagridis TaxID=135588 RepID=UPI00355AC19D|nr:hypothetical protein GPJ56_003842 [Histomonas meleagridis]KAH0805300.1 hypothetical protein GO595_002245 [Histomonas meleagridis]